MLLTFRVPGDLVRRADALLPALEHDAETATVAGRVSRSTVLRIALAEGLRVLERQHGDSPHYGARKSRNRAK